LNVKNSDLYAAREALKKVNEHRFPVKTSFGLAKLGARVNDACKPIDTCRDELLKKFGKNEDGRTFINANSPNWPDFEREFTELMDMEAEIKVDVVKLPEKVSATCDKCNHNMDRPLEIEPSVLMALEKFVEVA
jgi:hypothetical protein